jgi:hypothetical protein
MRAQHELLDIDPEDKLPKIDVKFTACRSSDPRGKSYFFDILDFDKKRIDRWFVPFIYLEGAEQVIERYIYPNKRMILNYDDYHKFYIDHYMTPHIAQLSPQGKLFVSFGVAENGFAALVVDTNNGQVDLIKDPIGFRLQVSGGDFDSDYKKWYFSCWSPTNTKRHERGKKRAQFDVRSVDIQTLQEELVAAVVDRISDSGEVIDPIPKRHHHITISPDSRYAVAASFDFDPVIPYPDCRPEEDPEGYRRTHEGGMRLEKLVTVDLEKKDYWQTLIPVPATGHIEFDLDEKDVFYASAHNISPVSQGTMLEGPGTIFKLRIKEGSTQIIGSYTNKYLYRITQHNVFRYKNKILIALTVVPNKLVIIDACDMSLWRLVRLFDAPEIVIDKHGVLDPKYPKGTYSLNPSKDGRYIVLESSINFLVYDIERDQILDQMVSRQIPKGFAGEGHTRIAGE